VAYSRRRTGTGQLYGAAVLSGYTRRESEAVKCVRSAVTLQEDDRYDSFDPSWNEFWASVAVVVAGGDLASNLRFFRTIANRPGPERAIASFGLFYLIPACGRADEAVDIATEAQAAANAYGNPFWIAWLQAGYRAFSETDPEQARRGFQNGLAYTRDQLLPFVENRILQELAWLEALHGTREEALDLFGRVLDAFDRGGYHTDLRATLCYLPMLLERMDRAESALPYSARVRCRPIRGLWECRARSAVRAMRSVSIVSMPVLRSAPQWT
jgi:tetratricopeptide (TPR) repeat protein